MLLESRGTARRRPPPVRAARGVLRDVTQVTSMTAPRQPGCDGRESRKGEDERGRGAAWTRRARRHTRSDEPARGPAGGGARRGSGSAQAAPPRARLHGRRRQDKPDGVQAHVDPGRGAQALSSSAPFPRRRERRLHSCRPCPSSEATWTRSSAEFGENLAHTSVPRGRPARASRKRHGAAAATTRSSASATRASSWPASASSALPRSGHGLPRDRRPGRPTGCTTGRRRAPGMVTGIGRVRGREVDGRRQRRHA